MNDEHIIPGYLPPTQGVKLLGLGQQTQPRGRGVTESHFSLFLRFNFSGKQYLFCVEAAFEPT
eukprot:scaffold2481_cov83-Cyclotella_meneghiniana.AAC.2